MTMNIVWVIEKKNEQGKWVVDFWDLLNNTIACPSKKEAIAWCQTLREQQGGGKFRPRKYVPGE